MRNTIITGIVLIIVSGIFAKFVFDDKTELRYVISDRIPTNFFDGKESESIQQLELLNTGDIELQRIIIKIKANTLEYYIQKVTNADSIIISKTNANLEIVYPQIPPESTIKIIIKSIGDGIDDNDIDIKHSKGSAKKALEENNSLGYISTGLIFFYLILVFSGLRTSLIESVASYVYIDPYDQILKKSKPWYVPLNKWEEFREDSIKHMFDKGYSSNIANTLYYQILDTAKQKFINDEEWIKIKLASQEKLMQSISENVNQGYSWEIEKYITLKRPRNIDDDIWCKIKSLISKAYTTSLIFNVNDYTKLDEIAQLLKSKKPELVNEDDWNKYISFLQKFEKIKIENELLGKLFKDLFFGNKLQEKPDKLSDDSWERLKIIEKDIYSKSKQIEKDLIELKKIESETLPLKEKLYKQLKIIHEILNDPTTIDRIEYYANPFSKGNFDNLKRITKLINRK